MVRELAEIARYYAGRLAAHGPSARGVDWNGPESQVLRFEQLVRLIDRPGHFSVNDLGCGYGAFFDFLAGRYQGIVYHGVDIAPEMIAAAASRLKHVAQADFEVAAVPGRTADFGFASGIFNVRLASDDDAWDSHVKATLDALDRTSTRGFAFNCLTSYSDPPKMRPDLYYASPTALFDWCKRRYAANVALLHDYGLFEFTILVRKA